MQAPVLRRVKISLEVAEIDLDVGRTALNCTQPRVDFSASTQNPAHTSRSYGEDEMELSSSELRGLAPESWPPTQGWKCLILQLKQTD